MVFALQTAAPTCSGIAWEEPSCLMCGGDQYTPIIEAADPNGETGGLRFAVVRCNECGLMFTSPRPNAATIGRFYAANYRPHHRSRVKPRHVRRSRWDGLLGRAVERRGLPMHGQGRLLDFGCGGGQFLERMRRQGWNVTGLDSSKRAVESVQTKLGIRAIVGTLPHPELAPESFDVVTMWHALEHVHDPLATLKCAYDLLAPGGRLIVAVPNISSLPFRWFGPNWFALDLPRHLTHFTPASLRQMVELAGFRVDGLRTVRHNDWLRSSAKLAVRRGRPPLWQRALTRKPLAKVAAWCCYFVGQSDCVMTTASKCNTPAARFIPRQLRSS